MQGAILREYSRTVVFMCLCGILAILRENSLKVVWLFFAILHESSQATYTMHTLLQSYPTESSQVISSNNT